jgi:hypothetical protein
MSQNRIYFFIICYFLLISLSYWPNLVILGLGSYPIAKYIVAIIIGTSFILHRLIKGKISIYPLVKIAHQPLFYLIFIGFLTELLFYFERGNNQIHILGILTYLIANLTFVLLLSIGVDTKKSKEENLQKILRPYFYISISNVLLVNVVFLLSWSGILDPTNWPLPSSFGSEFTIRISNPDYGNMADYYLAPLNLIVIQPHYIKIDNAIFDVIGSICGYFYEPHVASFFVTPSLFMVSFFVKKYKYYLYFLYAIFFFLTLSVTNILSLAGVAFFAFFRLRGFNFFFGILMLVVLIISLFLYREDVVLLTQLIDLVDNKFNSTSQETSGGYLSYILSPKSFVGNGFLTIPSIGDSLRLAKKEISGDIGIIGFLIILPVFLSLFYLALKTLYSKNYYFVGASCLYFFFHALKIPFHIFKYPYFILICFLLIFSHKYLFTHTTIDEKRQI